VAEYDGRYYCLSPSAREGAGIAALCRIGRYRSLLRSSSEFRIGTRDIPLMPMPRAHLMRPPTIRPARADEHDEIARVWMNSWASTGIEDASEALLAKLRARVSTEVEKGWSLFVADDNGTVAAMLALHRSRLYLDMLFVAPEYQGQNLGRELLAFTRQQLPDEISLRCVRENEKAWRWYEREGFVFEREAVEPASGFVMKYYRWRRESESR
jgi:ribosomal protein S18 acetylase RimI-like enzyme